MKFCSDCDSKVLIYYRIDSVFKIGHSVFVFTFQRVAPGSNAKNTIFHN